jgi:hypothetical protein
VCDIDVALVSDEFTGVRYFDIKKIGRIVRNIDYRIEVHPFSPKELGKSMGKPFFRDFFAILILSSFLNCYLPTI